MPSRTQFALKRPEHLHGFEDEGLKSLRGLQIICIHLHVTITLEIKTFKNVSHAVNHYEPN